MTQFEERSLRNDLVQFALLIALFSNPKTQEIAKDAADLAVRQTTEFLRREARSWPPPFAAS